MSDHIHQPNGHESSPNRRPDVEEFIHLQRVQDDGSTTPLDSRFQYNQRDPYVVGVLFLQAPPEPAVRWDLGREMLLDGMYEPTQNPGDFAVWPTLGRLGEAAVALSLQTDDPDEGVVLLAKTRDLQEFLNATLRLVPEGQEALYSNLDNELDAFLMQQEPQHGIPPQQL